MKRIWILSLFPDFFNSLKENGVVGRFLREEKMSLSCLYLGDYSPKGFKGVDASPYGGGPGMILKADILESALNDVKMKGNYGEDFRNKVKVIYTSPKGKNFSNLEAKALSEIFIENDFVFICGRYEGIDERFIHQFVDNVFSIGDYVLSGGEIPVMAIIDAFSRFLPGVLCNKMSVYNDSFEDNLLEEAQYTRPLEFNGEKVPEVLRSGNHLKIEKFKLKERLKCTKELRPDLYKKYRNKIEK